MKIITSLIACAGLFLGMAVEPAEAADVKVGAAAPDFKLPGSDGKTYKLSQFKGKRAVVVVWYPKAHTGGWTLECKSLRESGKKIREFDVAYFGASCDEPSSNKSFADKLKLDFPLLSDPSRETALKYGLVKNKKESPKRWTIYVGKDGKILHIDKNVKVKSHGNDIAKKLAELKVAKKKSAGK